MQYRVTMVCGPEGRLDTEGETEVYVITADSEQAATQLAFRKALAVPREGWDCDIKELVEISASNAG
jgi:hypothetical protein